MRRIFDGLTSGLNVLASVWILFLIALISADVIGRSAFGRPIAGVPEIVKFSIIAMVWLQMAHVLRVGGHLRTSLGYDLLPRAARRVVRALNAATGVAIFGLIAWLGSGEALESWEFGVFEGTHPVRIPVWPVWAILTLGAALTALQFVRELWAAVVHGDDRMHRDGEH